MPSSGVLQVPSGMPLPWCMFWVTALCSLPQCFLDDLARRQVHWRVPNLLASDQTTVGSLPHRLAYEVPFDRASLDQVKNRPQRASKLEALSRSEEHTSELQSLRHLVCRLLLEK